MQGMPFRDAYKKIGMDIEAGNFHIRPTSDITLTKEALVIFATEEIKKQMEKIVDSFPFKAVEKALTSLLT